MVQIDIFENQKKISHEIDIGVGILHQRKMKMILIYTSDLLENWKSVVIYIRVQLLAMIGTGIEEAGIQIVRSRFSYISMI